MNKKDILNMPNSAYRSLLLSKYKKNKDKDKNKDKQLDLKNWLLEKWQNLTPIILNDKKFYKCGVKSKKQKQLNLPSVCRPSIKINKKTPTPLSKDLTTTEIKKAVNIKKRGERINWNYL